MPTTTNSTGHSMNMVLVCWALNEHSAVLYGVLACWALNEHCQRWALSAGLSISMALACWALNEHCQCWALSAGLSMSMALACWAINEHCQRWALSAGLSMSMALACWAINEHSAGLYGAGLLNNTSFCSGYLIYLPSLTLTLIATNF
jgi:hypothetical protein